MSCVQLFWYYLHQQTYHSQNYHWAWWSSINPDRLLGELLEHYRSMIPMTVSTFRLQETPLAHSVTYSELGTHHSHKFHYCNHSYKSHQSHHPRPCVSGNQFDHCHRTLHENLPFIQPRHLCIYPDQFINLELGGWVNCCLFGWIKDYEYILYECCLPDYMFSLSFSAEYPLLLINSPCQILWIQCVDFYRLTIIILCRLSHLFWF